MVTNTSNYTTGIDIWCGIDVGKSFYHICAFDKNNKKVMDKRINQDEAEIRQAYTDLSKFGNILVIVDQTNTIGALVLNVARDMNIQSSYLPGLQMRSAARMMSSNSKTDPKDAEVIAKTAKDMPYVLRDTFKTTQKQQMLKLLCGHDDDLCRNISESLNQLRSLLLEISPVFERVFTGNRIQKIASLKLLEKYATPTMFRKVGKDNVLAFAKDNKLNNTGKLINDIFTAVSEQNVVLDAIDTYGFVISLKASRILNMLEERALIQSKIEFLANGIEQCKHLETIPGCGIQSAAKIVLSIGDIKRFKSARELACYAGTAPNIRQSGTSINSVKLSRSGNHTLKNTLFQISFCALTHDAKMKMLYDKKRGEGKRHTVAMSHLMRKRCNMIFAILKSMKSFDQNKYCLPSSGL